MQHPTTPPRAVRTPALLAPPLHRRLASLLYEALILLGIALATAAAVLLALHALGVGQNGVLRRATLQAVEFCVLTAYGTWFWSAGRQTLPMKTWRIRVVSAGGGALGWRRALLRALLSWLWVLPALLLSAVLGLRPQQIGWAMCVGVAAWALLSFLRPDRQYLHDALAGTRLIPSS
ncbi:RDD family protein [Thiomonas sp.]|uniref:RDD family protein n=1 Tax=Thiomonas sp. TaxID=2047785 RepID=UPI00260B0B55|nr:RDD family protein [Thiomonas sp.]